MRPTGLRTRLVLALILTSAVTLGAATAALLSPLRARLRDQNAGAIQDAVLSARGQLDRALRAGDTVSAAHVADRLARRTNARATLFTTTPAVAPVGSPTRPVEDRIDDVYRVVIAVPARTLVTARDGQTRIALPLGHPPRRGAAPPFVLAVRKANSDVTEAVSVVRNALVTAGLVGLAASVLLAIVLAQTLLRRLRRLRRDALLLERNALDAPVPADHRRDEVGDVSRALATMQEGLRRQETARRQFVATASHELRTPLTSLSGMLELLAEDLAGPLADPAEARQQVRDAQLQLARLRSLADELLDLSRLDAGVGLRDEAVDLGEIARAVKAELDLAAGERGQSLEVDMPPRPSWASGDPTAVARIARLLIDNAIRYTPRGGAITISVVGDHDDPLLIVEDTGPGVPDGERDAIFARFHRGSTSVAAPGFGLGLAIGSELAERMGGSLGHEHAVGGGSRFVLRLPANSSQAASDASGSAWYAVRGASR